MRQLLREYIGSVIAEKKIVPPEGDKIYPLGASSPASHPDSSQYSSCWDTRTPIHGVVEGDVRKERGTRGPGGRLPGPPMASTPGSQGRLQVVVDT